MTTTPPILDVEHLNITSGSGAATRPIVTDFTLRVGASERVGIVGESGSGKSMTAAAIMGLLPSGVDASAGTVGTASGDLLQLTEKELRTVRGRVISIVYQNALSSLNPVFPVGRQIADVARAHLGLDRAEAMRRAIALMDGLGIPNAAERALDYPHQFSGGMAQRVAIAMALVCEPRLVIADEPTTGLDATIQVQVLATIGRHISETGASLLLISHDLTAVASMTDRVVVLYAGMVLEEGPTALVMEKPLSPYTSGLVAASAQDGDEISFIPGRIPEPGSVPAASCPFADRCPLVSERCRSERPKPREVQPGRIIACHNVETS